MTLNADGSFTYTPAANFNGTDSFTYKAKDASDSSNVATVTLTVRPVNDAPVAANDSYTTDEDTALNVSAPGVLGNDNDVDGDSLTAVLVTNVAHGTLTLNANGSFIYTPDANYNGPDSFKYKANDGTVDSNVATVGITVKSVNDNPTVSADKASVTVDEGQTAQNTGKYGDVDGDTVTLSASRGNVTKNADGTWSWSYATTDGPAQSGEITITATDGNSGTATAKFQLTVNNVTPTITSLTSVQGAYPINTAVKVTATFTDPGADSPWTCTVDWDNGLAALPGTVDPGTKTYTATSPQLTKTGVYTVKVTITDKDGASTTATIMIAIYDPNAGYITGGGWLNVVAGSYTADPTLSGRANFGFNSQYKKGATVPTGETEFQFQVGNFNFKSTSYSWLVVSGYKAQYKGTGSVNGEPGYDFTLTAYDGQITGGGSVDKFRIRIVKSSNQQVVFDNRITAPEAMDTADPQEIAGGSIVIHKV